MIEKDKHFETPIKLKSLKGNKSANLKNLLSKIRKKPLYNAFDKQNLGCIPSKFDNYIFDLKNKSKFNKHLKLRKKFIAENNLYINDIFKDDHLSWKNYGTGNNIELKGNILKFSINNNLNNLDRKSEIDYSKNKDSFGSFFSFTNNLDQSSIKKSKDNNEQNKKETNKKYGVNESKSFQMKTFSKEDRFLNIFYKNKILAKYSPGPGEYNPKKENINDNKYRYFSLFKEKSVNPLSENRQKDEHIGPGTYNIIKDINVPGGSFSKSKKFDLFENNRDIMKVPGSNDLPGSINIKDIHKKNFYFMIHSPKYEKLEIKLGIDINNNYKINKNIYQNKKGSFEKGKIINTDWIKGELEKKIKEKLNRGNLYENLSLFKNVKIKGNEINSNYNHYNEACTRGKTFTFNNIPKFLSFKTKHIPGPCYYDPNKIMNGIKLKKNFNSKEDGWI